MRTRSRANRILVIAGRLIPCAAVFFFAALALIRAADQSPVTTTGFKTKLEYFDPPHELQVKTYLEGSESEIGPNGTIRIKNAKLQTFHEDGSREMIMNAPDCVFDHIHNVVSSSGPLQVQTWENKDKRALLLRGYQGFYWQQTNSFLIVSNRQSTIISGALTNTFNP